MSYTPLNQRSGSSLWAEGLMLFGAAFMVAAGLFHGLQGFAAVIEGEYFIVDSGYVYHLDVTAWGWFHIVLGALMVITGGALLNGHAWARLPALLWVICSAIINFTYLPYQPIWSMVLLVVDGALIWALAVAPMRERD